MISDVLLAERFAVRLLAVLPRAAPADVRLRDDDRRTLGVRLRFGDRALDLIEIVDVVDVQHLPAVRLEALRACRR